MTVEFSPDKVGMIQASALAVAGLSAGYLWLLPGLIGLSPAMDFGERITFTLRADILMFIWLAGCDGAVTRGRFFSLADIRGSAFGCCRTRWSRRWPEHFESLIGTPGAFFKGGRRRNRAASPCPSRLVG
jgi:hypothetical protein